jgi:S-adenosylmethionine:tRNA ribosyltransferase-isomerase
MRPARLPIQRPDGAKLAAIDAHGVIEHGARSRFAELLLAGDLVVANDAATLPASLAGIHVPTGAAIEVRLAQRRSLDPQDVHEFVAVVFGAGDHHMRTEDRAPPPELAPGDVLALGPARATIVMRLGHPRLVLLRFAGTARDVWAALARHGRPIQYAHVASDLALWDVWTSIAALPAAFEAPSAGFALDWRTLDRLRARGIDFATLTHAAGISSTGDAGLDRLLPLDEPYRIPEATAHAIAEAKARGGRVIAVGTTVVRALESAASRDGTVRSGAGVATQRIGPATRLAVVDAILSGTHEPGSSHYELLGAFAAARTLRAAGRELEERGYRTHEFGDSVLVFSRALATAASRSAAA